MPWDSTNSWKAFSVSCWLWKWFPCKKLSICWKKWLARGQVNMADEAKLHRPICSTFEALVVRRVVGIIVENWALPVDQCCWQTLRFLVHLITLLSIHLRCNGFAGIQKTAVDQTGSRPPNSGHEPFFWCKFGFWEVLWNFFSIQPLSWSSLVVV